MVTETPTKTEYCFRPTHDTHITTIDFVNTRDQNYTFDQLFQMNVTAYNIFVWSASIDVAEQYQYYLDQQNQSFQSNQLFFNCTSPWFGSRCQYSLETNELEFTALTTGHTCYIMLECDRGGPFLCLDWREICDGRIDCLNNGVDEANCFELEINECKPNEYRCHNGQCIAEYYWKGEKFAARCLDQSDFSNQIPCPTQGLILDLFYCEENTCPPGRKKFSCGDGQCVDDFDECLSGRHLMLYKSLTIQGNLSYHCWIAMVCLTQLIHQVNQSFCDEFLQSTHILFSLHTCDYFTRFPINPVLLGHIYFLYQPQQILEVYAYSILLPKYICYDEQLCTYLSPTFRYKSHTCRSAYQMGLTSNEGYSTWKEMIDIIKPYFYGCTSRYIDQNYSKHSSLYQCRNTSKYISKHRIADDTIDCYWKDDEEDLKLSCSLHDPRRFTCPHEVRCRSPILQSSGCPFVENPGKSIDKILFNQICDGVIDVLPELINGENHTDESNCEYWPCNNVYTRCDGFWSCRNGEDEEKCRSSNCSRHFFECISPYNYTMICLPATEVRNGIVDCLGGLDELQLCQTANYYSGITYGFRCLYDTKCIEPSIVCDSNDELFYEEVCKEWAYYNLSDLQNILCYSGALERVPFTLKTAEIYPFIDNTMANPVVHSTRKLLRIHLPSLQCTRGSLVHLRLGNDNYTSICMCPPNYYGNQCQYQNQRAVLILTFSAINNAHRIYAVFIKLIDDDNNREDIQSYEQIIYVSNIACGQPFERYFLYSTRPKDVSKNYSLHIDIYYKISLEYIASWYFKIRFNFLPVNRLAVVLTLGSNQIIRPTFCTLTCEHGICMKYMNEEKFFCHCKRGWTGARCHIPIDCNDCSSDSICADSVYNRSICICPLTKFGNRCLVKHSCPVNYCQNNGLCIVIDEQMTDNSYECLCSEEFQGKQCEHLKARLYIALNDREMSSYLITYIYSFIQSDPPVIDGTVLKKLIKMQSNVTLYSRDPFQVVFIWINTKYFLAVLQHSRVINISTSIDSTRQCPSVNELLNSKQIKLSRIQRIKYYHTLCLNRPNLKCFFDESYMCLCTTEHHANCFPFNHKHDFECQENVHCLNGGQCLQDDPKCPVTTVCECIDCFFGDRCQFQAKGIGLTLDDILRYAIRPNVDLKKQSPLIKVGISVTVLLFVVGLINSVLSLLTFRQEDTRTVGCGIYLLTSSIISVLTVTMLLIKFWFVLLTQMNLSTSRSGLRVGCLVIEPLLKTSLWMNSWLSACVAIERAVNTWKGVYFNKPLSKKFARVIIIFLPMVIIGTHIFEWKARDLFDDQEEQRLLCVTLYSELLYKVMTANMFCHFMIPFGVNLISALYIIISVARRRAARLTSNTYYEHLKEQFHEHKHLIISPIVLVILGIPLFVISLLFRCVKTTNNTWLYLSSYFISFIPSALIFVIYILPSALYKKAFLKSIKRYRRFFARQ
ncbi:unnamed protein product [Adineta steineri]|uniref:Uncharacterized protein n=1 Tax=Adineta steineri TaxID=433720 RepID=A0A819MMN9_9BILA|nr:unnamed protein product [Adineta steineri]